MTAVSHSAPLFLKRCAGVLLHPTSLPNSESCFGDAAGDAFGNLGSDAYRFVDFMAEAGLKIWQMLPSGPTQDDLSPYQSISAHAGNPDLISIDWLVEKGWIDRPVETINPDRQSMQKLRRNVAQSFFARMAHNPGLSQQFLEFCQQQSYWLDDFSLFVAIRAHYHYQSWLQWPQSLRKREDAALADIKQTLSGEINQIQFEQFAFFQQWWSLRHYAQERGIVFFGDMPIFVGHDSADVWSRQQDFQLDSDGNPISVAGVPPDYFSETGQHWGNPHYAWDRMQADGFQWWLARFRTQLQLFDMIRVDHFRGFEAYWSIPGGSKDARNGEWVKAPGRELLTACINEYPGLPLVAENLGVITDEVEALRKDFHMPGMLVLQFAFDGNTNNPHLPHNHRRSDVIYTGTHDNDTTVGWLEKLPEAHREQLRRYCYGSDQPMPWLLIDVALSSVARMAIIPMQDFLELDGQHRMNMPGTTHKNWVWKFAWDQADPNLAARIHHQLSVYHRLSH